MPLLEIGVLKQKKNLGPYSSPMSIFMGLNMSDVLNDVLTPLLILLKYYFAQASSWVRSQSPGHGYNSFVVQIQFCNNRLWSSRTWKIHLQMSRRTLLVFLLWNLVWLYIFIFLSWFHCLWFLPLGRLFFLFDVIFSAKSINPIISLTNIALWNECKTNGHFYHMVFKLIC